MGLSNKGVSKILNIECLIYGTLSLLIGLPLSIPVTWGLYKITNRAFAVNFSIPWYSVVIAIGAVFIVVFVTMFYASGKIKKDNTLDAIRAENI
jgi:putative ABC transport system permease protein